MMLCDNAVLPTGSQLSPLEDQMRQFDASRSWHIFYENLNNQSAMVTSNMSCEVARCAKNRWRNRYRDISPYDHNRVLLPPLIDGDYINASYVSIPQNPSRVYIMTQGPMQRTASHFWLMVWESRSPVIIMLNRIFEKGTLRCFPYFPSYGGPSSLSFSDTSINVHIKKEDDLNFFVRREFEIEQSGSGERRTVIQMHFQHWPDFGVPSSPGKILNFLWAVRATGALSDPEHPPIVHCSAGVGRSGAFVLIDFALQLVENERSAEQLNLSNLFLDLRRCRMGTIQTPDQLRFCFDAVILAGNKILRTPEDQISSIQFDMEDEDNQQVDSSASDDTWSNSQCYSSSEELDPDNVVEDIHPRKELGIEPESLDEMISGKVRHRFPSRAIEQNSDSQIDEIHQSVDYHTEIERICGGSESSWNPGPIEDFISSSWSNIADRSNNALPTVDQPNSTTSEMNDSLSSEVVHRRSRETTYLNSHGDTSFVTLASHNSSATIEQSTPDNEELGSAYLNATQDLMRRRQIRRERHLRMRQRVEEIRSRMREQDLERRRWLPDRILRLLQRFYVQSGLVQTGYGAILSTTLFFLAVIGISRIAYIYWRA